LGERIGISQAAISKFELGERQLKKENIIGILSNLKINRDDFFCKYVKTRNKIRFSEFMNPGLAQVLGYLLGDGNKEEQRIIRVFLKECLELQRD
jgi:transcriptional regulator with XRE-family HTH domain